MNVNYIRAAIEANTGIRLTFKQTVKYLLEEGLVTKAQASRMLFPGYEKLFPSEHRAKKGEISEGSMLISVDVAVKNTHAIFNKDVVWNDS